MKKIDLRNDSAGNIKKLADIYYKLSGRKCELSRIKGANKIVIYDTDGCGQSYVKYEILLDEKVSGYIAEYDEPRN